MTTNTAEALDLPHAYDRIALVDLSCRFKQIFHSGEPSDAAERTMAELASINAEVDHMIVCMDAPPYKRAQRFDGYKAHREEPSAPELYQRRKLRALLEQQGWPTARVEGYEADDVIATLARQYAEWCPEVLILGGDKDLAQLIQGNVLQITPASGERQAERRDAAACKKKFGVAPEHMRFWQALRGDKTDNIPGVPGIGEVRATTIVEQLIDAGKPVTPPGFIDMVASAEKGDRWWSTVSDHWDRFTLAYELVTLDVNVPLDADVLLTKRPAVSLEPRPEEAPKPQPIIGKDPNADAILERAERERNVARINVTPKGAKPTEQEIDAMQAAIAAGNAAEEPRRIANQVMGADSVPINDTRAELPPIPPKPAPVRTPESIQLAAMARQTQQYGLVSEDLQPRSLEAVSTLASWHFQGGLYRNFKSEAELRAVILRGIDLGLRVTTALAGTHMIEGKPVSHADVIRALAEKDPNCEYFMCVESTPTKATWETKHKRHPRPTTYTYTIEEAQAIQEYWRKDKWGNPSNWGKRPRDMLAKTASCKLARLVYAGATMGLYCPEEINGSVIDTEGVER